MLLGGAGGLVFLQEQNAPVKQELVLENKQMEKVIDDAMLRSRRNITEQEVQALEAQVAAKPDDIAARARLLGFYFLARYMNPAYANARQRHILWLICNAPETELLGSPEGGMNKIQEESAYVAGRQEWQDQLAKHPNNLKIIKNAASYLRYFDQDLAVVYLRKGAMLDAVNPDWPWQLGQLYMLDCNRSQAVAEQVRLAKDALAQFEKAYAMASVEWKDAVSVDRAEAAFMAGDTAKAEAYALALLAQEPPKNDWNYGNRVHQGYQILGLLALEKGQMEKAKECLLQSARLEGSPQLNSFGPKMALAAELLKKGERAAVLEYFAQCGKFWRLGKERLQAWTAQVQEGKIPDFGVSLSY